MLIQCCRRRFCRSVISLIIDDAVQYKYVRDDIHTAAKYKTNHRQCAAMRINTGVIYHNEVRQVKRLEQRNQ